MVGGCVRDALMGVAPKDFDVEVYGVEPTELKNLLDGFGRVDAVGEAFTVYKLGQDLDVSLPRRERVFCHSRLLEGSEYFVTGWAEPRSPKGKLPSFVLRN